MRFGVLGPLTVQDDAGDLIDISARMPRTVLAALLMAPNRIVSVETLTVVLWGERPPASVANSLQNHVLRLRRLLGADNGGRIAAVVGGYRIEVAEGELDHQRFVDLAQRGRDLVVQGLWADAGPVLRGALQLWRGDPLADLPSEAFESDRRRLGELHLRTLRDRVHADLAVGRHEDVVAELAALTNQHPLVEGFHADLMLALYRCGRQAEALAAHQRLRRTLNDELGVDPGRELAELYQRILAHDPELAWRAPPTGLLAVQGEPGRGRPAQLPPDISDFTGRAGELASLVRTLSGGPVSSAPRVCVITGPGGIGKTALAVHAAGATAACYPDGQLYVDMRGADGRPRTATEVLTGFLRELGADPTTLPVEESRLAARYRSVTAGRAMLFLLDNANEVAGLRPLIPASPTSAVLITSRNQLGGLPATSRIVLGGLSVEESSALLAAIAGPERQAAEPDGTWRLLAMCGGLPLAVRITGARLAVRSQWSASFLADRLSDTTRRLDELAIDDLSIRASIETSYDVIAADEGAGRLFRLLGLAQLNDIRLTAVRALAGPSAETALGQLLDLHLVEATGPDRYRWHDLIALYAAERSDDEPVAGRAQAIESLITWYLHALDAATRTITPARAPVELPEFDPGLPEIELDTASAATAWCEQEVRNLVRLTQLAADQGLDVAAWQLAMLFSIPAMRFSHFAELIETARIGLLCARRIPDRAVEGHLINTLGAAHWSRQEYTEAIGYLRGALEIARELGDLAGESRTLINLAHAHGELGEDDHCVRFGLDGLRVARLLGNPYHEAVSDINVSQGLLRLGRLREADVRTLMALRILEDIGHVEGQGFAWQRLAEIAFAAGHLVQAGSRARAADRLFAEVEHRDGQAAMAVLLADIAATDEDRDGELAQLLVAERTYAELGSAAKAQTVRARITALGGSSAERAQLRVD
jgi:DNA-binding SARP family transcriptional activator/tetratricopeptide (TPR) repeat protein